MDFLSIIKKPISNELNDFVTLFNSSLTSSEPVLSSVLEHIRQRGGKRMRPILTLLTAKNYGAINETTHYAAMGLELLHTASLVHDDVVDESSERRGQPSVNASYNNKVAVIIFSPQRCSMYRNRKTSVSSRGFPFLARHWPVVNSCR